MKAETNTRAFSTCVKGVRRIADWHAGGMNTGDDIAIVEAS